MRTTFRLNEYSRPWLKHDPIMGAFSPIDFRLFYQASQNNVVLMNNSTVTFLNGCRALFEHRKKDELPDDWYEMGEWSLRTVLFWEQTYKKRKRVFSVEDWVLFDEATLRQPKDGDILQFLRDVSQRAHLLRTDPKAFFPPYQALPKWIVNLICYSQDKLRKRVSQNGFNDSHLL